MLITLKVPEELYLQAVQWLAQQTEKPADTMLTALTGTNLQLSAAVDELRSKLDAADQENWALRERIKIDAEQPRPILVKPMFPRLEQYEQEVIRLRAELEALRAQPAAEAALGEQVRQEARAAADRTLEEILEAADQPEARHEAPEPPPAAPEPAPAQEPAAAPEAPATEAPEPPAPVQEPAPAQQAAAKRPPENADDVAWATQFVRDRAAATPGALLLARDLPAAYEAWAANEPDAPKKLHPRWLGTAMKRAGYVGKPRWYPEEGKSAQTYVGVEILTPAQRRQRDSDNIRAAADAAKKSQTPREIDRDEAKLDPYVTPKVVDREKPGIVHVRAPKPPTKREQSGVTVVRADGKVTTVQEYETADEAYREPVKPEDADGLTFDIYTDCQKGTNRPYSVADDVLAMYGVETEAIEAALRNPQRVTIRPESKDKGYPVLAFHRGDLDAIVGFRTPDRPKVMAAYVFSSLAADSHRVNHSGGGGARASQGLPTTVKASVKALRQKGLEIPDTWESATSPVEVRYEGKVLGKMKVHLADKSQVQGDYQRLLRQAHAIDRRKEMASA